MSLVYTNTPAPFQPVLSDGLFFTMSADTTNNFKFRYIYDLYVNDEFVFRGKCTPNPYGLGIADLQQILETYTFNNPISNWNTTPIYTHQTFPFSRPYTDEVVNYYVVGGYEYASSEIAPITGFTGVGDAIGDPATFSDVYKTFRSTMGVNGRATQQDFNIGPFIMSGSPAFAYPQTSGLFLTNSPRIRDIAENEYYTLGFTNYYLTSATGTTYLSEPYYVEYKFYDFNGDLITGLTYDNITTNGGGPRTSCDQVYQELYLIMPPTGQTEYNTLYVGAGPQNIPNFPQDVSYYTVQLYGVFEGYKPPIQPTPTPTPSSTLNFTPTPTPTPSTTPVCSGCTTYDVLYTGESAFTSVTIINCDNGSSQTFKATAGVVYQVCSCQYPLDSGEVVYTVGGACGGSPPSSPTPTPTRTMTPTPSLTTYTYLGRTTPDQDNGSTACAAYTTVRSYVGLKPLASLTVGDYLYDTYPASPTDGNNLWVALKVGGAGQGYAFQVADDGEILDTYIC